MLSITLPHIAVQKVSNGYVVEWQQNNTDTKSAERTKKVAAVCTSSDELLATIERAAADVSALTAAAR